MIPCLQQTTHFLLSTRFVNLLEFVVFSSHTLRTVSEGHVGVYWFVRLRMHMFACAWDIFYVMCVYVSISEWYCQARRCSTYPHRVSIAAFCSQLHKNLSVDMHAYMRASISSDFAQVHFFQTFFFLVCSYAHLIPNTYREPGFQLKMPYVTTMQEVQVTVCAWQES